VVLAEALEKCGMTQWIFWRMAFHKFRLQFAVYVVRGGSMSKNQEIIKIGKQENDLCKLEIYVGIKTRNIYVQNYLVRVLITAEAKIYLYNLYTL
jgi:hypothetical protein